MDVKSIVKILDRYTTPNTRSIECPYYDSLARSLLKEINSNERIFTVDDMLGFAFFAREILCDETKWVNLNEKDVEEYQTELYESKFDKL